MVWRWWGRGATNCFAIWPRKNGPYHEIFIGNGKTGEEGHKMQIDDIGLGNLIIFLMQVRNGFPPENE